MNVLDVVIPKGTGRGFRVDKGQIVRVLNHHGPQVADFNAFSADNPAEIFSATITRRLEGTHLTTGAKLWSRLPFARPMFKIIADTVVHSGSEGRNHDLLFPPCSMYTTYRSIEGDKRPSNCYDSLQEAAEEIGLDRDLVHDPWNIFMKTGIDEKGHLYYVDPDSRTSDYVDLLALMDCYVCISACAAGSNSPDDDSGALKIEVRNSAE